MGATLSERLPENMQKFENYKEQYERLKKALKYEFYLEAVFIEYAIMEDRLNSILRYEGNSINSQKHVSIDKKINKVKTIARGKNSLPNKYFTEEFLDRIHNWKERRNPLIHSLMKLPLTTEELRSLALEGEQLTRDLCRLATNYKRAVERKQRKEQVNGI